MIAAVLVAGGATTSALSAQSITAGALRGSVRTAASAPLGAVVTIEGAGGAAVQNLESRADGSFIVRLLLPGTYSVLAEVPGYQPVRHRGVVVAAGKTTSVALTLTLRPPPITSVTEVDDPGVTTGSLGRLLTGSDLMALDVRRDLTDLSRSVSEVVQPFTGWGGFGIAAGGLAQQRSRLFVDGTPEQLLRHPGVPRDPASTPVFQLDGIQQAQLLGSTPDGEWRGVAGSVLGAQTTSGQNQLRFAPFVSYSGSKVGGKALDNPGDSIATSIQVGAALSGALKPDTAHFFLGGSYQSLRMPSAFPWEVDTAVYRGQSVSLRTTLPLIGADSFSTQLGGTVAPAVRTWKGGNLSGRVDWRLDRNSAFMLRAGFASWKETNPSLSWEPGNDAGTALNARDISVGMSLLTLRGQYSNEVRAGFSAAKRDWSAASLPATRLVREGILFGSNPALPGLFDTRGLSLSEALQYVSGRHAIKTGLAFDYTKYRQNYRYGAQPVFGFGDLDRFGAGSGTYFATLSDSAEVKFSTVGVGVFIQDTYEISSRLQLLLGLRWETQLLPKNRVSRNVAWKDATLISADSAFKDRRGIQPRFGFVYHPSDRADWVIQGELGLYASGLDPALFAEAIQHNGSVRVTRAFGALPDWPTSPSAAVATDAGVRLTLLSGSKRYRAPRTFKARGGITGSLGGGFILNLAGGYSHTDFLQRRSDLNRQPSPSSTTQEGRPVYGVLVHQGSLIAGALGTGRRFAGFDLVSGLAPTGYSDYYELSASLDRQLSRALSLSASYTYSRTRDNLVGLLQVDPADQLSPFAGGIAGADWDAGRSDVDVPHRLAAVARIRTGGSLPVSVAVRGRWRSGLPFTPGFRNGVDINGDLGGNNDPVTKDAVTSPTGTGAMASCDGSAVGAFAARNSCRERGIGALDARLAINIPWRGERRLAITVDALNVAATTSGVVDHAAVLIDPTKNITTAGDQTSIPFLPNPRFGTLLSRRGEPRYVRFGLRVEY